MEAMSRRLLFKIGEVGFSLRLEALIEICEQVAGKVEATHADTERHLVGSLPFRKTRIPVVGLAERLGLQVDSAGTALVLASDEGNWALLVSEVVGFVAEAEISERPLPRMLQAPGWRCFERACLYDGLPYLTLDLASCYSGEVH